jgi:hypothetical protein
MRIELQKITWVTKIEQYNRITKNQWLAVIRNLGKGMEVERSLHWKTIII